jgi:Bacteriocin-protection, YdeI or OmpD-Associated
MVKCDLAQHMLPVLQDVQNKIGNGPGDTIHVVVERDEPVRTVEAPPEPAKLLKKEKLMTIFESLSYTHRREYCRWIIASKKEQTRRARLAKAVVMLRGGVKTPG